MQTLLFFILVVSVIFSLYAGLKAETPSPPRPTSKVPPDRLPDSLAPEEPESQLPVPALPPGKPISGERSGQMRHLPQSLTDLNHPDPSRRAGAADALGNLLSGKPLRSEMNRAILDLGRLSRDREASVRRSAVAALGKMKSKKAVPFLKRALRDVDGEVVRRASAALEPFKGSRPRPEKVRGKKPTRPRS